MYVQGFGSLAQLDGFFDGYVCASEFLAELMRSVYGIDAPVIPPFDPSAFSPALTSRLLVLQSTPFCNINCDYCYLPDRSSTARSGRPVPRPARATSSSRAPRA